MQLNMHLFWSKYVIKYAFILVKKCNKICIYKQRHAPKINFIAFFDIIEGIDCNTTYLLFSTSKGNEKQL